MKIYLAGPEVFLEKAVEIGVKKKQLCADYGHEGLFPFDNEINMEGLSPFQCGLTISKANESMINLCDIVIANITPFRGPSADVGTVYEIGYAIAKGKTVYAYTNNNRHYFDRVQKWNIGNDECKKYVDVNNTSIENFDMVDNLMIHGGIQNTDGFIYINKTDLFNYDNMLEDLTGFTECLKNI